MVTVRTDARADPGATVDWRTAGSQAYVPGVTTRAT